MKKLPLLLTIAALTSLSTVARAQATRVDSLQQQTATSKSVYNSQKDQADASHQSLKESKAQLKQEKLALKNQENLLKQQKLADKQAQQQAKLAKEQAKLDKKRLRAEKQAAKS